MARLTGEELRAVMEKYGVNELWSWSKVDTAITSMYEYFLKYVLRVKEDRTDCAYAPMGGICHSTIEDFYSGKIKHGDMIEQFSDGWVTAIDIADLKFDRNDAEKNSSISGKYKMNLEHFFRTHKKIPYKVVLEKFMTAKIGDHVFQGYIDAIYKDADDNYHIVDWKTSTKYSGKTAEEKCGQLVVYAIGLNQAGVPMDKIKICWNFLKYVSIQYKQKNGVVKTREVERNKIGESLQSNAKVWLKEYGYADKMDDYLKLLLDANSIEVLPEEVQKMYTISDCYVYVPLTQALIDRWVNTIITTIADVKLREADYAETKNDKAFWDTDESVQAQSYYFATLCGYSPNLHLPYKAYLDKLDAMKNGANMFSGVGSGSEDEVPTTNKDIHQKDDGNVDLSWLDSI